MKTETPSRKRYFLALIDDFSRFTNIYLLKSKDEVSEKLKEYLAYVKNRFGKYPKMFRSDNGSNVFYSEYIGKSVQDILKVHESINKTPFELWNGEKPKLDHLKSFGSIAFAYVPAEKRTKWDPHAKEGVFVGYDVHSTGYRILDPLTSRITISRTVEFIENEHSGYERTEKKNIDMGIQNEIEVSYENNEENILRKIEDIRKRREVENQIQSGENQIENEEFNENQIIRSTRINKGIPAPKLTYMATNAFPREPKSFGNLMSYPECEKSNWQKAIHDELESFNRKGVWELTELPTDKELIDQENKINKMVDEFGLTNAYPVSTPMDTEYHKLNENSKLLPNNDNYRKAVGVLLYLSTKTRPDIKLEESVNLVK
ncbi:hypothetical protein JTB14_017344 [Gonioctena quinquepunctata]|nr:hypothetical protein JTB14_017344 [Gonioctena quinquepunctata]